MFDRLSETHDCRRLESEGEGMVALTLATEGEMVLERIPTDGLCLVAAGEKVPSEETGEKLDGAVKLESE